MSQTDATVLSQARLAQRRSFGRAMHWDPDLPGDLVEQLWSGPFGLITEGEILQDKPRCITVRINRPRGNYLFKHYNWGGPIRTLKKSLGPTRLEASWFIGRELHASGVPTPCPRAYVERRLGALKVHCYLLTDFIAGTTLYRLMRHERPSQEVVLSLARQVAAICRLLDDLSVSHNDLKAENILIDRTGRAWLIDLESVTRHRNREEARLRLAEDIGRLLHPRNWRTNPAAAEIFRQELAQALGPKLMAAASVAGYGLDRALPASNQASQLLTVLIPSRNNESVIADCLNSVRDIADEIIVADRGSTDATLEIARRHNCRIVQKPIDDETEFENLAAGLARHPWVLRLLPQERVSPDLAIEIQTLLTAEPGEDGFSITRRYIFWGKLLRYGLFRHDSFVRLFRKGQGKHRQNNRRTEVVISSGREGRVRAKILYQACWSVRDYLESMQSASSWSDKSHGLRQRSKGRMLLWRAHWKFIQSYILRFGWLDGWAGLHASCLAAIATYLGDLRRYDQPQPQSQFSDIESELAGGEQAIATGEIVPIEPDKFRSAA